jgi:hypothetical protein
MMTTIKLLLAFCLLAFCITPVLADDSFASALAQAHENTKSEDGEKYDTAFGESFGSRHVDVLSQCTDGLPDKDMSSFDVVALVASDGSLENVLVKPEAKVAICLRQHVLRRGYPQPPKPHYWVHVQIKLEP